MVERTPKFCDKKIVVVSCNLCMDGGLVSLSSILVCTVQVDELWGVSNGL